jgi:hypothetical protein
MQGQTLEAAAAAAGMSERSARTWQDGPMPSTAATARTWRTRTDPVHGGVGDRHRDDPYQVCSLAPWGRPVPGLFASAMSSALRRHHRAGARLSCSSSYCCWTTRAASCSPQASGEPARPGDPGPGWSPCTPACPSQRRAPPASPRRSARSSTSSPTDRAARSDCVPPACAEFARFYAATDTAGAAACGQRTTGPPERSSEIVRGLIAPLPNFRHY